MVVNLSEVKQHPPDETRTPFKLARRHISLVTPYLERSHRPLAAANLRKQLVIQCGDS